MNLIRKGSIAALAVALCIFATGRSNAQTFTFSSGAFSATATFSVSGGEQYLRLENTSNTALTSSAGLLTALFFDSSKTFTPTGVSTPTGETGLVIPNLPSNSTALVTYTGPLTLNDGWAYNTGLTGAPNSASQSVQAAGLGLGGSSDANFGGSTGHAVDGQDFGIIGPGGVGSTGGVLDDGFKDANKGPYSETGVIFDLGLAQAGTTFSNVWFQYGTALGGEPGGPGGGGGGGGLVPEASTMALLAFGGLPVLFGAIRARKRS